MTAMEIVLIAQALASGVMCGVIWFVQVVHYPLFTRVGAAATGYSQGNQSRTARVVLPPMLVEGATAAVVALAPPPGIGRPVALAGVAIVAMLWLSTAFVQMPLHRRLSHEGHRPETVASLVRGNWLRTVLWTARAGLALWMLRAAG